MYQRSSLYWVLSQASPRETPKSSRVLLVQGVDRLHGRVQHVGRVEHDARVDLGRAAPEAEDDQLRRRLLVGDVDVGDHEEARQLRDAGRRGRAVGWRHEVEPLLGSEARPVVPHAVAVRLVLRQLVREDRFGARRYRVGHDRPLSRRTNVGRDRIAFALALVSIGGRFHWGPPLIWHVGRISGPRERPAAPYRQESRRARGWRMGASGPARSGPWRFQAAAAYAVACKARFAQ